MAVLEGKTALVTGGSRGIGRAVVERLARDGATVVFGYESDDGAARSVEAATGASVHRADMGDPQAVARLVADADRALGGLDVLVTVYAASKAAVEQLTAVAARELGPRGVVAFLVGPDGRWVTGQNLRASGGLP